MSVNPVFLPNINTSHNKVKTLVKYFNVKTQKFVTIKSMARLVPRDSFVVMSDTHYDNKVQLAQSKLMTDLIHSKRSFSNFDFLWEFLNYQDNSSIEQLTVKYKQGEISPQEYLSKLFNRKDFSNPNDNSTDKQNPKRISLGSFFAQSNFNLYGSDFSSLLNANQQLHNWLSPISISPYTPSSQSNFLQMQTTVLQQRTAQTNVTTILSQITKLKANSLEGEQLFLNPFALGKNKKEFFANEKLIKQSFISKNSLTERLKKQTSKNESYLPLFQVVKDYNGRVFGINARRSTKQAIINTGINSIDKKLIPPNHYVGGEDYLERFTEAMGDHVPKQKLADYFEAQCFTDSVMAYQSVHYYIGSLSFVLAGSFHTDYFDATVVRLNKISPKPVVSFRFLNINQLSRAEIRSYMTPSAKYGAISDILVLVK